MDREQLGDESVNAAADVVAEPLYDVDGLPGRVDQIPVDVPFPGKVLQASPQPIAMITSEA